MTLGLGLALCTATACGAHRPRGRVAFMQSYVLGTLGDRELDVRDVCPSGWARRISVSPTPLTVLAGIVTLGLYTPREVVITCVEAR